MAGGFKSGGRRQTEMLEAKGWTWKANCRQYKEMNTGRAIRKGEEELV